MALFQRLTDWEMPGTHDQKVKVTFPPLAARWRCRAPASCRTPRAPGRAATVPAASRSLPRDRAYGR